MLSREMQTKLAARYVGDVGDVQVKKAFESFDRRRARAMVLGGFQSNQEAFEVGADASSAVVFVDIAGFSTKIEGLSPRAVRDFLDTFYATAIPIIYENRGVIDRIVGDGIIAVYSEFFDSTMTLATAENLAFATAEGVITKLSGTMCESKAAIAAGNLLYCKTGLADFYEDLTVVGHPMTEVYRLEGAASVNQLVVLEGTRTAQKLREAVASRKRREAAGEKLKPAKWFVSDLKRELQGMGEVTIVRETYGKDA